MDHKFIDVFNSVLSILKTKVSLMYIITLTKES